MVIYMNFESREGDVEFRFALDFGAERIQFDLFRDVGVRDTGTAEAAERVHEVRRFSQDYFGNGQLHITNTDTGELIGRKDAYIPVNMYLDGDGAAAELAYWKAVADQRRDRDRRYGDEMERNAVRYEIKVTVGGGPDDRCSGQHRWSVLMLVVRRQSAGDDRTKRLQACLDFQN
jgi:hypothetical protein